MAVTVRAGRPLALLLPLLVLPLTGCIGATAQLLYMMQGVKVPAEFDGLKGKRVAVVCVSDASLYGSDRASQLLAGYVESSLAKKVKGIHMIRQQEVLDWLDNNDWDQIDFTQIGRGVDAEMLVAIELSSYRLNNGQTLYQGRADVTVTVYDIANKGAVVFRRTIPQFTYPKSGGQPTAEISRAAFEQQYIAMLGRKISNYFYDYEMATDFGQDAASVGG